MTRSCIARYAFAIALAAALATIPLRAGAQEDKGAAQKKTGGGSHSMTGCLQKGMDAKTFQLTNVEGTGPKTVDIVETSKTVDLAPHIGHKVTITGTEVPAKGTTKTEGAKETKKEQAGHQMRVTAMKHVSASCP
jgi:hypothetical protein